jgi:hypothetical protein
LNKRASAPARPLEGKREVIHRSKIAQANRRCKEIREQKKMMIQQLYGWDEIESGKQQRTGAQT